MRSALEVVSGHCLTIFATKIADDDDEALLPNERGDNAVVELSDPC